MMPDRSAGSVKTCPLCGHDEISASWLGSTYYRDKEFTYMACCKCRSLFCEPMPDDDDLAAMYGTEYGVQFEHDDGGESPKQPESVLEWLKRLGGGTSIST